MIDHHDENILDVIATKCLSCKAPGKQKQIIQTLPGDGKLWRVEHDNGKVCYLRPLIKLSQMPKLMRQKL